MDYLLANDKRKIVNSILFVFCCLLYAILEIFVLSKFEIQNQIWFTIWTIAHCLLGLSPIVFFVFLKWILNKPLMLMSGIKDLTGVYLGEIVSVRGKQKTTIIAEIEIIHKLEKMSIRFKTAQSTSKAKNIMLSINDGVSVLIYNYENTGDPTNSQNKMHIGTCDIEIRNQALNGSYYNNGRDRKTYGSISMKKKASKK